MRTTHRNLSVLASAAAFILLAAWSQAILACSCSRITAEQHVEFYALIFQGTAEWVDHKAGRARFKVNTLYKGVVNGDTVEIRYNNAAGSLCGIRYAVGETRIISTGYMENPIRPITFHTSLCSPGYSYMSVTLLDKYRRAAELAIARTEREPNSVQGWFSLAELQEAHHDYLASLRSFERLQQLVPGNARFKKGYGDALAGLGRFEEAVAAYDAALTLDPTDPEAKWWRETSLLTLGRPVSVDPARRHFRRMYLPAADFSGRELPGADFWMARMGKPKFARARMEGADFSFANVYAGDFKGADLRGAGLTNVSGYQADFSEANLSNANLAGAGLAESKLDGADLSNADFTDASLEKASLVGAKLKGTRLTRTKLVGVDLSGADLSGAHLHAADFSNARLANATFTGAVYNERTVWPSGFDPLKAAGLTIESARQN